MKNSRCEKRRVGSDDVVKAKKSKYEGSLLYTLYKKHHAISTFRVGDSQHFEPWKSARVRSCCSSRASESLLKEFLHFSRSIRSKPPQYQYAIACAVMSRCLVDSFRTSNDIRSTSAGHYQFQVFSAFRKHDATIVSTENEEATYRRRQAGAAVSESCTIEALVFVMFSTRSIPNWQHVNMVRPSEQRNTQKICYAGTHAVEVFVHLALPQHIQLGR
jgi:hypothetical protein